ncbi:MAG TPA: MipA/OmpV family protein [Burkholderiales bacterium]|nr:MipA/OmpV family protein [Burkholderiales bacterium]
MRQVYRGQVLALALATVLSATNAGAASDPFIDVLPVGGTGVGYVLRFERSTYIGDSGGADQTPLYLYEGEHAYLHGTRLGLKASAGDWRFDAFLAYRFEGFTHDKRPTVTEGLAPREPGWDAGVSVRRRTSWGTPYVEVLHDVSTGSNGTELRAGYWNEWRRGRLTLKPQLVIAWRDESLNNFYYGTSDYQAGAGVDAQAALYASYALTESWNLLGGVRAARRSHEITASPLAQGGLQTDVFVGFLYDFSPKQARWTPESKPLIVKLLYGQSSDCNVAQTVELTCTTRHTVDNTDIAALHIGRKLIERAGGWPVDLAGFVGIQRHLEKTYQDDFWSLMAFFKVYWYGFGWERWGWHTRLGMGSGLSYSEQISTMEQRDQAKRGRGNWKLLNYLDPSFDVRVARDTYVGVGVSHRSGAFGKSEFFGNVDGGSNYIYVSFETTF